MSTKTATPIQNVDLSDWVGTAALYRLDPPVLSEVGVTDYVVVSSIDVAARQAEDPFLALIDRVSGISRTEETLVFPADDNGEALDWDELALVEVQDHVAALAELGYEVAK